jgi:hypothetical protein
VAAQGKRILFLKGRLGKCFNRLVFMFIDSWKPYCVRHSGFRCVCPEWQQRNIEIFQLLSYSPQLNLIEILWRFIKYEWIEISAYRNWQSLVQYVEKVLKELGTKYVINFV